jgi:hypothetical protein
VLKSTLALLQLTESQHRAELRSEYQQAKVCLKKVNRLLLGGKGLLGRGNIVELWALAVDSSGSAYFPLPSLCVFAVSLVLLFFFMQGGTKKLRSKRSKLSRKQAGRKSKEERAKRSEEEEEQRRSSGRRRSRSRSKLKRSSSSRRRSRISRRRSRISRGRMMMRRRGETCFSIIIDDRCAIGSHVTCNNNG